MNYEFENGTETQKRLWAEAVQHLLHLPADALPLTIAVSFVSPPLPVGHTDLAVTNWEYGSADSTTEVRSDAPGFGSNQQVMEAYAAGLGVPFSVTKFYMECAAHELGHSLFAALPHKYREAIAQMFGAASDDIDELIAGEDWRDRYAEGIAETFKDAFLPRRFRVFSNRTNRTISYADFPEFRRLFREGATHISTGPSIPEQIAAFFEPDDFTPSENPLSGNWLKWQPANNIGKVVSPAYAPQNLLISAALRTDQHQSGPQGATMATKTILTGSVKKQGACGLLLCADNTEGGIGYVLRVEWEKPNVEPEYWRVTLQYWEKGVLKETLLDLKEVVSKSPIFPHVALTLVGKMLTVWIERSGEFQELGSVNHVGPKEGYPGVFIDPSELLPSATPRLNEFTCGELEPEEGIPIEVPGSEVIPTGADQGTKPHDRPAAGQGA